MSKDSADALKHRKRRLRRAPRGAAPSPTPSDEGGDEPRSEAALEPVVPGSVTAMDSEGSSRSAKVRSAIEGWTKALVNLDGRNRMLYFRELSKGTLEITPGPGVQSDAVARLLTGESVRLSDVFDAEALADAAERARALAAKARSNFEEMGLATLYVGYSFATWQRRGATPSAPVVLIPSRIRLDGPVGEDATIETTGPPAINFPFAYAMREETGRDPYPEPDQRTDDYQPWIEHVARTCRGVDGFFLDDRLFLANLEFTKLPMVLDLERNLDMLAGNDLVAAIAGDEAARSRFGSAPDIEPDYSDHIPPEDEFLVCDADASQSYVVAAARQGSSLVMHGPPGTGKSQTIANLISSLAADGKTVLFVAQKRAAIGAVTRRLDAAGCGDLVLDLHDGSRRRDVARSLGASIEAIGPILENATVEPHAKLAAARKPLVAHRRQMHRTREPHGMSFSELQSMLGTPDSEITGLRLTDEVMPMWTEQGRARVRSLLAQWRNLSRVLDDDPTEMWAASSIRSSDQATEAKAEIEDLVDVAIPAVEGAYRRCLADLSLPEDSDVPIGQFADVVVAAGELSERYSPEFFDEAEALAADLVPAERSRLRRLPARLLSRRHRRARRRARTLGGDAVTPLGALGDARRVVAHRTAWHTWFPGRTYPPVAPNGLRLREALTTYRPLVDRLAKRVPGVAATADFGEQSRVVRAMLVHRHLADAMAERATAAAEIAKFGLGPLLRTPKAAARAKDLSDLAMRVFAASAIDMITWQEPELAVFDGEQHQKLIDRYVELDRRHLATTARRVMRRVAARAAAALEENPRAAALIRHEAESDDHLAPVRQMIGRAPQVVQALRPCWAMSPLLVSRLLPSVPRLFDVVVFDEASQIVPTDAIPAIGRGAQVIVAGDPRQLPPSVLAASESSLDEEERDGSSASDEAESILDVMRGLLPERRLVWHYRSQDERLINFANLHTYGRSLISFPGTNVGTGLRRVLVDGVATTTEETASNPGVVAKVVELILEHAAESPDESLGVIAMGRRHANAITEALRSALAEGGEGHHGFFEDKGAEPFFVKVMEEAQGDERDHIILSVGYGRNPDGEMVYRWGALARRGGERRLNVAITRAKRRMTVVSSIAADEIDPTRTRSRGAALLADYLEYADRGGAPIPGRHGTGPLTRFEASVRNRLRNAEIPLEPHHGIGPLRIDFAAFADRAMEHPLLAIETDGVGYDFSETVRERDRLRREVLEKRGWRYHRIWSIDWYRDPGRQVDRTVAHWEQALAERQELKVRHRNGASRQDRPVVAGRGRSPVAITGAGILDYSRAELVQLVEWIQSDGVDRSDEEVIAEAVATLGIVVGGGLEGSSHRAERALRGAIRQAAEDRAR